MVLFKRFEHLNVSPWETSSPALSIKNIHTEDAYVYTKWYISIWLTDKGGLIVPWSRIYPYPQSIVMPHRTLLHSSLACLYAELPHQLALCGTQWSLKQGWWYVCQSKINKTSVLSFVLWFMKYHLTCILHCSDWPPIVRGKISHLSLVLYVQMIICHKEGWYKFEIRC